MERRYETLKQELFDIRFNLLITKDEAVRKELEKKLSEVKKEMINERKR